MRPRMAGVRTGIASILGWMVVLAVAPGCGSGGGASKDGRSALTPADFAAASAPASPEQGAAREGPGPRRVITSSEAREVEDVIVLTGAPVAPPAPVVQTSTGPATAAPAPAEGPAPATSQERALQVDQLVGQINGRPIYADEFFSPMDERLRREAERLPAREWIAMARKDIEGALWDTLRDELLLAEFESGLKPEERMGVFAFIEQVRKDIVSGNLGSEALATQRLLETEDLDLQAKVDDVTQREFIRSQLIKAIGSRVSISGRDIQQYYDQNRAEFFPPPVAHFVILRVPLGDEARVAEAETALSSGESFEAVAARLSTWRPDTGNEARVTLKSVDDRETRRFGPDSLNQAALALAPGQVSPRIDFAGQASRGDAYWIKLARIEEPPGKSLYDAQTQIEQKLRARRAREEETRYFTQLFARGSFSDVREMTRRLLDFAAERYLVLRELGPEQPASSVGTP